MSDKYFAVQFRSMHTAIHSVAVFTAMNQAQDFFDFINSEERLPEEYELDMSSLEAIEEINFRNPPDIFPFGEYNLGLPLEYMNNPVNTIPDAYNY
jgi:tRNA(Leu) C34 or U34 (ribose-2'-O)-methylase TrmL